MIELIGFFAAVCTATCNIPQLWKIIKTKKSEDLSLVSYTQLLIGVVAWVVYGFLIDSTPVVLSNCFSLVCISLVLILQQKYKDN